MQQTIPFQPSTPTASDTPQPVKPEKPQRTPKFQPSEETIWAILFYLKQNQHDLETRSRTRAQFHAELQAALGVTFRYCTVRTLLRLAEKRGVRVKPRFIIKQSVPRKKKVRHAQPTPAAESPATTVTCEQLADLKVGIMKCIDHINGHTSQLTDIRNDLRSLWCFARSHHKDILALGTIVESLVDEETLTKREKQYYERVLAILLDGDDDASDRNGPQPDPA